MSQHPQPRIVDRAMRSSSAGPQDVEEGNPSYGLEVHDPMEGEGPRPRVTTGGAVIKSGKPEKVLKEATTKPIWFSMVSQLIVMICLMLGFIFTKKAEDGSMSIEKVICLCATFFSMGAGGNSLLSILLARMLNTENKNFLRKEGLVAPKGQ